MRAAFNRLLDTVVRPEVRIFGAPWHAFQLCGYTGLVLASLLTISLAVISDRSLWLTVLIIVTAVATFFSLAIVTKIVAGQELIIYYHHQIAVLATVSLLLSSLSQPVLRYLDITTLGIGVFLTCGRIGCLMVGCCHGRPNLWGVCYRAEHADAGFTPYFVGVRLFPIQAVESLWVLAIVLVGLDLVLRNDAAGTVLAWYVVMYGLGRFCIEFLRGDPERSYLWGYSQPQWISLLLMCGVVGAELTGILPLHPWHIGVTVCVSLTMIAVSLKRRLQNTAKYQLLHPSHVKEVAETLAIVSRLATETPPTGRWTILPRQGPISGNIHIGSTSVGIQISAGKISERAGDTYHYTLSRAGGGMTEEAARVVGRLICHLKQAAGAIDLVKGSRGVFHLVIRPESGRELAHR